MRELNQWRQDAPPPRGIKSALSRAKRRQLDATLTDEEWASTLAFFGGLCAYCQRAGWCLVDHVTPVERGGGTTHDNCLPCCGSCNRYKGQRTVEELIVRVGKRDVYGYVGREGRQYAAVSIENLNRALRFLGERGRPPSVPVEWPTRCASFVTCNLGHTHGCRLAFAHDGPHDSSHDWREPASAKSAAP